VAAVVRSTTVGIADEDSTCTAARQPQVERQRTVYVSDDPEAEVARKIESAAKGDLVRPVRAARAKGRGWMVVIVCIVNEIAVDSSGFVPGQCVRHLPVQRSHSGEWLAYIGTERGLERVIG